MSQTSSNGGGPNANDVAFLLARMRAAVIDFENQHGRRRTEPIELTQEEYDQLKAAVPVLHVDHRGEPLNTFYGVRLVIKKD